MEYDVSRMDPGYRFTIHGASFIGSPRSGTVLFVTKKVRKLLENLKDAEECLVFAETGLDIPEEFRKKNCFVTADDPQRAYAEFALEFRREESERERQRKWTQTPEGAWLGENVTLGTGCVLENGCRIGHDVVLGDGAFIGAGSTVVHAEIGKGFGCLDRCSVGLDAFFMAEGENRFRIPSFGKVFIGDRATVGMGAVVISNVKADTKVFGNPAVKFGISEAASTPPMPAKSVAREVSWLRMFASDESAGTMPQ